MENDVTSGELAPQEPGTQALDGAPNPGYVPSIWNDNKLMAHAFKAAKFLAASDLVPEATYRDKPANCLIALDIANRLGMSPLIVMQQLYIVKGKPSWSGQFCVAAIQNTGRFSPLEYLWGEGGTSCSCQATRKADGAVCRGATVSLKMAQDEGWMGKSGSKWKTMPQQMLMYRAATFFARTFCPEVLLGLQTADEVTDVYGPEPETAPATVTISLGDVTE
jgi:hypothetical protein